jgi:hypothetical protein
MVSGMRLNLGAGFNGEEKKIKVSLNLYNGSLESFSKKRMRNYPIP